MVAPSSVKTRVRSFLRNEKGAVAFEYVLIIGGVSAVIILAIALGAPSLMTSVLDSACEAVDAVLGTTTDCTPSDHDHSLDKPGHPAHGFSKS